MIAREKLMWIRKNLVRRDISRIAGSLKIPYHVAYDVLKRNLEGKHYNDILNTAERLIVEREKEAEEERLKYGT
ncbi:hypothetical protein [Chitinophaga rhizosphaerae]|uniref:hypothetical protein n=1 Tax=Chitinophaga rhizosphaerae TaxID=1864947 RepID=UPI000F7FB3EC|nr:hypothetical protein [Chitinophaga rhizosphaerae]